MIHRLEPTQATLHGYFSCERAPVLEIDPGDSVVFSTLDAGWNRDEGDPFGERIKEPRPTEHDTGHALVGPVFVRGAKPGMSLEVRVKRIVPGSRGWTAAGGFPMWPSDHLGITSLEEKWFGFALDVEAGVARNARGGSLPLRPFMGIYGNAPATPGIHATRPPRRTGGNIDCKELVVGSTLWLPIEVDGALFSTGDGHAMQGDGEVAGPAMECPMREVELEFHLVDRDLKLPRAMTPGGWVTFGFHEDLNRATVDALGGMVDWLCEARGMGRQEALALFSLIGDLRVTQLVNLTKGVHAVVDPIRVDGYLGES